MVKFGEFAKANAVYEDEESGAKLHVTCLQGGDMKYLLLIYGLASATSNHPCVYCLQHKDLFFAGWSHFSNAFGRPVSPPVRRSVGVHARACMRMRGFYK